MKRQWRRWGLIGLLAMGAGGMIAPAALASDRGFAAAEQVSLSSYQGFLNSSLYTHNGHSRGPSGAQHDLARNNIRSLMESYGLSTSYEVFTYNGQTWENVVGVKTGTVYPSRIYIIGAHYDSVSNPGADDNASGTAAVLEAARILSQYPSDCTLRFIAFDMEEAGLIGSTRYVAAHKTEDIRGMLSADMIAFDTGEQRADIHGHVASAPIKIALGEAVAEYGDGLIYFLRGPVDGSDHAPFEAQGFQACLLIEGSFRSNPNCHTQADSYDTPGYLNFPFAIKMTRSLVGCLVDLAGVQVPLNLLHFDYPDGLPELVAPAGGTRVRVVVSGVGTVVPQPGTAFLHYDAGNGWQSAALEVVSDNVYDAVLPAAVCGEEITYYFTAQAVGGAVYDDPHNAPGGVFTAIAGEAPQLLFFDDFESNLGWTVGDTGDTTTGVWERAAPEATGAQPGQDHTPDPGTICFVTDHRAGSDDGSYDVDSGKTTLTSPVFDLSRYSVVRIGYWRWYFSTQDSNSSPDIYRVYASGDGGGTWVVVESVGPAGPGTNGGWLYHEFNVGDFVPLTSSVRVRFVVGDMGTGSIVEGALDDFAVWSLDCLPIGELGDLNCDGLVNNQDIDHFIQALLNADAYRASHDGDPFAPCNIRNGDFTGDGLVNNQDIDSFTRRLFGQ